MDTLRALESSESDSISFQVSDADSDDADKNEEEVNGENGNGNADEKNGGEDLGRWDRLVRERTRGEDGVKKLQRMPTYPAEPYYGFEVPSGYTLPSLPPPTPSFLNIAPIDEALKFPSPTTINAETNAAEPAESAIDMLPPLPPPPLSPVDGSSSSPPSSPSPSPSPSTSPRKSSEGTTTQEESAAEPVVTPPVSRKTKRLSGLNLKRMPEVKTLQFAPAYVLTLLLFSYRFPFHEQGNDGPFTVMTIGYSGVGRTSFTQQLVHGSRLPETLKLYFILCFLNFPLMRQGLHLESKYSGNEIETSPVFGFRCEGLDYPVQVGISI